MKIVAICGAGIGSSGILKVNAERVLQRLGLEADVTAAHIGSLVSDAADAQIILTSAEFVPAIGKTFADVIVIENYFDTDELSRKLEAALGS
ncbi:MAG TPA: PTS ascorbate transporter subunit IIB [Microbacteriaceae bacterium]|jgi:PTS system ascorbate-specific IIB component|nr:PTS ascorbate transporter subunit IIB [Microbacteriaceae bacterium]